MSLFLSHNAVVIRHPRNRPAPLVFDSPHSGLEYPSDFRPDASRAAILTTCDAFVDELWADAPDAGATLLAALFPRAYIDPNRSGNDIDPEILATPWPEPTEPSEHLRRGMGLIRRFALPGVPMYDRLLPIAAVRHRIDHYYTPYRRTLRETLDAMCMGYGCVLHFNCHSMKSRGNAMNVDSGTLRPDFVIGDREGTTAPPELTGRVARFFSDAGYRTQINDPYRGGDIVRRHGAPARHRYSIQIEINRALYMDESRFERGPHFAEVRALFARFAGAMADVTREQPSMKIA